MTTNNSISDIEYELFPRLDRWWFNFRRGTGNIVISSAVMIQKVSSWYLLLQFGSSPLMKRKKNNRYWHVINQCNLSCSRNRFLIPLSVCLCSFNFYECHVQHSRWTGSLKNRAMQVSTSVKAFFKMPYVISFMENAGQSPYQAQTS